MKPNYAVFNLCTSFILAWTVFLHFSFATWPHPSPQIMLIYGLNCLFQYVRPISDCTSWQSFLIDVPLSNRIKTPDEKIFVFVNFALYFSINSLQCIVARKHWMRYKHIWVFSALAWHLLKSFIRTLFPPISVPRQPLSLSRLWFEFHVSRRSDCLIA